MLSLFLSSLPFISPKLLLFSSFSIPPTLSLLSSLFLFKSSLYSSFLLSSNIFSLHPPHSLLFSIPSCHHSLLFSIPFCYQSILFLIPSCYQTLPFSINSCHQNLLYSIPSSFTLLSPFSSYSHSLYPSILLFFSISSSFPSLSFLFLPVFPTFFLLSVLFQIVAPVDELVSIRSITIITTKKDPKPKENLKNNNKASPYLYALLHKLRQPLLSSTLLSLHIFCSLSFSSSHARSLPFFPPLSPSNISFYLYTNTYARTHARTYIHTPHSSILVKPVQVSLLTFNFQSLN